MEVIGGFGGCWVNEDDFSVKTEFEVKKTYDNTTGLLTISNTYANYSSMYHCTAGLKTFNVYLII